MSVRHMKKETPGSRYFSFFALSDSLAQTCLHVCRTGQLSFWTCKQYIAFISLFTFHQITLWHFPSLQLYWRRSIRPLWRFTKSFYSASVLNSSDRKEWLLRKWFYPLHWQPPAIWKSECCLLTSCFYSVLDKSLNICKWQRTIWRGKSRSELKFMSSWYLTWSGPSISQRV